MRRIEGTGEKGGTGGTGGRVQWIPEECQDQFSSTISLGGPGLQGTNEEVM